MDPVTEMFVSPIVSGLIIYMAPLIWSLLPSGGIGSKLKEWSDMLEAIQAVLDDAESSQLSNNLIQPWLREVQKLVFDIEDLVDRLATEDGRRKMVAATGSSNSNKVGKLLSKVNPKAISFNYKMERKIGEISDRLQQLEKKRNFLNLQRCDGGNSVNNVDVRLPSTSLLPADEIYGRKEDADVILKWLLQDRTCNHDGKLCTFSIVGMGGMGKTTLAQSLYNDKQVKEFFQDRAWVCVTKEFDVFKISKIIYEEVFKMRCDFSDLNMIQVQLKEKLSNKKFLIVLDDVWNDEYTQWDLLCTPFCAGTNGSTIIITTRNQGVANLVCSDVVHVLKGLSDGDCLSLLAKHAFQRLNFDEHQEFRKVGEVIAERCKGLPLAAKSLGGLLRTKRSLKQWEEVSTSKIWKLDGIIPALRLSYHHLPPHLKPLFAYCSLFPKGFEFADNKLILLWMAQGFLRRESGGEKQMEEWGDEYFSELLSRSFFQPSARDKSKFVMHDLNNDLAQFVAGPTYLSLDNKLTSNEQYKVSEVARHASITSTSSNESRNFKAFDEAQGLRTLLPIQASTWSTYDVRNMVVKELPSMLQCLRVLSFSGYLINELPNSIGDLKHLRYLNLSRSRITKLPESICDLYNLQTLILYNCYSLSQLPSNLQKLINLRHLDIENTPSLEEMPSGISMLTCLRTLQKFFVGKNTGWKINELKSLHYLQGTLSLIGMENVTNAQDAIDVAILRKKSIHGLKMKWNNNSGDSVLEFNVLEALKPHIGLRSLEVEFYGGQKFPDWIGDRLFKDMVELRLVNCKNCENLPPLGQLTSLKMLFIKGMDGVKAVGTEFFGSDSPSYVAFQSLVELSFVDMGSWEEWSADLTNEAFPCLKKLALSGCMKLDKVSLQRISFSSLKSLNIDGCSEMVLRSMVVGGSVKRLDVGNILMLSKLDERMIRCLGEVEEVRVSRCQQLRYLWEERVACQVLHKLKYLNVRECEELECLGDEEQLLPHNIENLTLYKCKKLAKIPDWRNSLTSLRELDISNCEKLDGMLASTTDLKPKTRNNMVQRSSGGNLSRPCSSEERGGMNRMGLAFLERLYLCNWANLKSLPQGFAYLTFLYIEGCSDIELISETSLPPTLLDLNIWNCENLKYIHCTNKMQSLTSLKRMQISSCNNLENYPSEGCWPPNLEYLKMGDVKQPITEWGLATLPASLLNLEFKGKFPELVSYSEVWNQLSTTTTTSLTMISFYFQENMECLGEGLENLSSIEHLLVFECLKFGRFPKSLPPNLSTFQIVNCPIVKQRLMKKKKYYLSKLSDTAIITIDDELIWNM